VTEGDSQGDDQAKSGPNGSPLRQARVRVGWTQAAAMRRFARAAASLGEVVPSNASLKRMFAYQRAFVAIYQTAAKDLGFATHGEAHGLIVARGSTDDSPSNHQDRPAPEALVEANQASWREVRRYLIESGIRIADQVANLYDRRWQVVGVPALAPSIWLPKSPVPLDRIKMRWDPEPTQPTITGAEAEAANTLPLRVPGHAFERYTSAIRYISPPALFENRHSYRMTEVEWGDGDGEMTFGLATFFDKLDVSEPLSHESAVAAMAGQVAWSNLPFRGLIADPFDLAARVVNPGIATLTIRRNVADGTGSFFLLRRDPTQVTNGRHYSLLPAGEFQPASIAAASIAADLDLWRNMVREYREEMLGRTEHDGSGGKPLDYEVWPFFRDMNKAREAGDLRAYALGVVLDALSLNAVIATAVVINDDAFDRLFRGLVSTNPEGEVVGSLDGKKSIHGLPFDDATVTRLIENEPLGQTSAACLSLAWRHRFALLP